MKKSHLRRSKSENFLEKLRSRKEGDHIPMLEYFTRLSILNTPSLRDGAPKKAGRFVKLAHANDEFEAPILTKGKSVSREKKRVQKKP